MNWLAHAFLSDGNPDVRLGNLLADIVKRQDVSQLSEGFRRGMAQHRVIDAFTDSHVLVRQSRLRLRGSYRHTRGIIIDLVYDHFLAANWDQYSPTPLSDFTQVLYEHAQRRLSKLPEHAREVMEWIIDVDCLSSYETLDGLGQALSRLSRRLAKRFDEPFALENAVAELRQEYAAFKSDFVAFFPLLRAAALNEAILTKSEDQAAMEP